MDFRKQYTKHIKENVYNFAVAGDIDQENPVNPDNAKEIQDLLRKKGVSANVSPSETKYNEVVVKSSFTKSYIKSLLDRAGILESLIAEATWEYVYELESDHSEDGGPHEFDGEVNAYSERDAIRKVESLAKSNKNRINKKLERSRKPGLLKVQNLDVVKESLEEKIKPYMISYSDKYGNHVGFSDGDTLRDIQNKAQKLRKKGFKIDKMGRYNPPVDKKYLYKPEIEGVFEGFVPFVPAHMRYMNKKKAQDAIDKVTDRAGNIRFVKHFENDTVGLVRFIYGEKELKNFDFQFPGIFYKNKRVTFHDLILKAREKVDGAKKILGLGKYKKEEKEVPVAPTEGIKKEKNMKEAFPKPKEDKDKKIKDLENKVQKLEVEKESELNPEPNPDTGEIPLQVGVAYKYIRDKAKGIVDKEEKKKEKKEVKVGKKTLTNKRKEKIDVEPEMEV